MPLNVTVVNCSHTFQPLCNSMCFSNYVYLSDTSDFHCLIQENKQRLTVGKPRAFHKVNNPVFFILDLFIMYNTFYKLLHCLLYCSENVFQNQHGYRTKSTLNYYFSVTTTGRKSTTSWS